MDLASLIGFLSGIALIIASILMNSGLDLFWSAPSLMIVAGGTIAASMIAYPMKEVMSIMGLLKKVFLSKQSNPGELVKEMTELSKKARQEGILGLDSELKKINDEFLKKGLQLVVDGVGGSTITNMLKLELDNLQKRHTVGVQLFSDMGKYAPAFGMVGTLIGLVQMLADLNDISSIGPKMAVALITTFYGSLIANMIFVPMSVKLKRRSQIEATKLNLISEGINSIRLGENHRILQDKLVKFLSDDEKKKSGISEE